MMNANTQRVPKDEAEPALDLDLELPRLALDEPPQSSSKPARRKSRNIDEALVQLQSRVATVKRSIEKSVDERVLQSVLPLWDDGNRGVPNPLIRSGLFTVRSTDKREFIKRKVASLSQYEVHYQGQELQQDDLSVWMSLINMAREMPVADAVYFTGYRLIKDLGLRMHSDSYKRIRASIERLKVTGLEIASADGTKAYSGSLIRDYAFESAEKNGNAKWMVRFESKVAMLFMEDTTTLLEWETRKKIGTRATLALWLHAFYSSHRDPIPLPVAKIHELCGSGDKISSFRRNLDLAFKRLIAVEFLVHYDITNDIVQVKKKLRPKLIRAK